MVAACSSSLLAASRATETDRVGTTIGHYRIDALIGEGGMGRVYAGTDELLGRRVAIKALLPSANGFSTRARDRLLREARSLARLDHPAICRIHDDQGPLRKLLISWQIRWGIKECLNTLARHNHDLTCFHLSLKL